MKNLTLIRSIVSYLRLSSMEPLEKGMWFLFLPFMDENGLNKLNHVLEKEVNAVTDVYLQSLSDQA